MEFWEFLIQQDGDRSWLPIESPGAEILEGRYRVVARSSRTNAPVEIRLTHIATEEDPPRRRTQKRMGRTNPEGLIVVMPFTRLQPGVWELRCAGDLMEDMMGNGWRYAVQLQVLAQESERGDRWEGDLEDENSPPEEYVESVRAAEEPVEETQSEPPVDAPEMMPAVAIAEPEPALAEAAALGTPDWSLLRLAIADHYSLQRDQVLQIHGEVLAPEASPDLEIPVLELQLILRDPQTAQVLTRTSQSLEAGSLPRSFALALEPPELAGTQVLLGEVSLLHPSVETPVAFADFTVTAGLNDLLESIANNFVVDLYPPPEFTEQPISSVDLSFLEFINSPKPQLNFHQSGKQVLPPQLYRPDPNRAKPKAIELPVFDREGANPLESESGSTEPPSVSSEIPPALMEAAIAAAESIAQSAGESATEDASLPESVQPANAEPEPTPAIAHNPPIPSLAEADTPLDWEQLAATTDPRDQETTEAALSTEDIAFRALNLQHRFWKRLYEFAGDQELRTLLQSENAPVGNGTQLAVQEVLAEDDASNPVGSGLYAVPQAASEPELLPAPSDEDAVPVPDLLIPPGELISGERITLTVKLPEGRSPLYVKLWVSDPQTHTILDGPRWITGFVPDGFGNLAARTKLTIPHGCLEVKVEAIAIDVATQRESHKASLPRAVVPPNLPTFSMDDLEP